MEIIVKRGTGNRQGADIIDPLLSTVGAAQQRGRNEIDEYTPNEEISMDCIYRDIRPGQTISVEGISGLIKVTGVTHNYSGGIIRTQIAGKKPI